MEREHYTDGGTVDWIEYDPHEATLLVRCDNGARWKYTGVVPAMVVAMRKRPTAGTVWNVLARSGLIGRRDDEQMVSTDTGG